MENPMNLTSENYVEQSEAVKKLEKKKSKQNNT
jgi:hypothetical protein